MTALVTGAFALLVVAILVGFSASQAAASHGGATVGVDTEACGETTFTAAAPGNNVTNMYLVVEADGVVQSENIPTDGSSASITVGPFHTSDGAPETISWRVFGGAERNYDDPHWNGYGDPGFVADIGDYADEVGGFGWVLSGTDDPNPFTTWNTMTINSCEITKSMCKRGGFSEFGFKNQGLCIRFANTGKDSR